MPITVKRRTETINVVLDQEKAQELINLGKDLTNALNSRVKVEGGNPRSRKLAQKIEALKAECAADTLTLELRALPFSKWRRVLEDNTPDPKKPLDRDMVGLAADAVAQMAVTAMVGGELLPEQDLTTDELRKSFDEMTDGQLTIIVQAVMKLNGEAADPKAAFDLASKTLDSSRS